MNSSLLIRVYPRKSAADSVRGHQLAAEFRFDNLTDGATVSVLAT